MIKALPSSQWVHNAVHLLATSILGSRFSCFHQLFSQFPSVGHVVNVSGTVHVSMGWVQELQVRSHFDVLQLFHQLFLSLWDRFRNFRPIHTWICCCFSNCSCLYGVGLGTSGLFTLRCVVTSATAHIFMVGFMNSTSSHTLICCSCFGM